MRSRLSNIMNEGRAVIIEILLTISWNTNVLNAKVIFEVKKVTEVIYLNVI